MNKAILYILIKTLFVTAIDVTDELICKITDKGVDISYPTNNPREMETQITCKC